MALTRAQFITRFPEFASTDTDLIDARLTDAADSMSTAVWGDLYDQGQGFLCAHLLASSGYGVTGPTATLFSRADAMSTYGRRFEQLSETVSIVHLAVI